MEWRYFSNFIEIQIINKLEYNDEKIINKHIVFKDKIGRLRDVDINSNGEIFIITDELIHQFGNLLLTSKLCY